MTISYKEPDNQFVIYAKDGLVLKIEHTDEFGKSHVYRQTLLDRLQKMNFENKEYLNQSRAMMQDVFKGEFPFMDWHTGKYEALVNSNFHIEHLDITFSSPRLECNYGEIIQCMLYPAFVRQAAFPGHLPNFYLWHQWQSGERKLSGRNKTVCPGYVFP